VTVSSAFMSSRRDRINFRVSSASGRVFKAAANAANLSAALEVLDALETAVLGATALGALDTADFEADLGAEDFDADGFGEARFGEADLDNTDVARDHSFHCIASAECGVANHIRHVGLRVSICQRRPTTAFLYHIQLPSGCRSPVDDRCDFMPLRNTQAGARCWAKETASVSGTR
jgi:hypothetical protein